MLKFNATTPYRLINFKCKAEEDVVSETMNHLFSNIRGNLNIPQYKDPTTNISEISDPVIKSVEKFKNYPSIQAINRNGPYDTFSFSKVNHEEIVKEIKNLDTSKASQVSDIPTKIIKTNCDIFSNFIHSSYNKTIEKSEFPRALKLADVTPIFKKGERTEKGNYRPVSILSNLSKIYERIIYNQLLSFFDTKFSKFQCGFRKRFSTQHALLAMIEKWKKNVDNGHAFGAVLTDLSKAFDCLPHDLIIAKLKAYGLDEPSLQLLQSYLSDRQQRTKIGNTYSSCKDVTHGVPQGSILGPLLFNIFLCDMFFILEDIDIASYADDTTPYASAQSLEELIIILEDISDKLFHWFTFNEMKANESKCHLLLSKNCASSKMKIDNIEIENSESEKLLGIQVDCHLNVNSHLNTLCKKASSKIHALARISPYLDLYKRKLLMNSFFNAQFGYCPLVWMFCSRSINNKINSLHERCLRLIYNDKSSSFDELLKFDKSVTIHQRNLQKLALEMFKVLNSSSPEIMKEVFPLNTCNNYDLRHTRQFLARPVKSVYYGTESISFLAPKIWEIVPEDIKASETVAEFKTKIKIWIPDNCPCRLCRTFVPKLGFI